MPSIWLSIWLLRFSSCSISFSSDSRRASARRDCPSINSRGSSRVAAASTSRGSNSSVSRPSRSASSRPRRAISSNSCPSAMASCDRSWVSSRRISNCPASTRSPSSTRIWVTTPPSRCCTTWRLRSTSSWPEAMTAPEILVKTDQTPKPPTRAKMVSAPTIRGVFADQDLEVSLLISDRLCRLRGPVRGSAAPVSAPRPAGQRPRGCRRPASGWCRIPGSRPGGAP